MTATKPIRAYTAHDGDDAWCVVFATSGAAARRYAANEMGVEFEGVEWCRRLPTLDQYAPGPVPPAALVAIGWRFECCGCLRCVDRYTPRPAYIGCAVYCSPWCRLDSFRKQAIEQAAEREAIVNACQYITSKWPGTTVDDNKYHQAFARVNKYGIVTVLEVDITFSFPGEHRAKYRRIKSGPAHVFVYGRNEEAWNTFMYSLVSTQQQETT